jgi:uncharacterized membrane protein YeaQ/YmgE (transglycosylase-associated protein family)
LNQYGKTLSPHGTIVALFVLIILGTSLGWFASVLARTEAAGAILRQIGIGIVAALAGGLVMNGGTMIGGLSLLALGTATLLAIAALALYHALVTRREEANL